ncbi:hypothetical protein VB713_20460 [Anabaena cylindrica UHCC 0172]|uniref:hypothetical protein n=1 Tax=Anabaena cylindrica TaxID=1165 RepID=UPI002B1F8FF6|nr:hypothetical protein [Anabaena cylindrica]MEA5553315.1 hypothetical protein [Anabaena cylindrica UHCC 0172]
MINPEEKKDQSDDDQQQETEETKDNSYWEKIGVTIYEDGSYETEDGEYYNAQTGETHIPF